MRGFSSQVTRKRETDGEIGVKFPGLKRLDTPATGTRLETRLMDVGRCPSTQRPVAKQRSPRTTERPASPSVAQPVETRGGSRRAANVASGPRRNQRQVVSGKNRRRPNLLLEGRLSLIQPIGKHSRSGNWRLRAACLRETLLLTSAASRNEGATDPADGAATVAFVDGACKSETTGSPWQRSLIDSKTTPTITTRPVRVGRVNTVGSTEPATPEPCIERTAQGDEHVPLAKRHGSS